MAPQEENHTATTDVSSIQNVLYFDCNMLARTDEETQQDTEVEHSNEVPWKAGKLSTKHDVGRVVHHMDDHDGDK